MISVYYLYVDIHTLDNTSSVLDQLQLYEINENREQLLFAITSKKKYVKRFFEIHRKEMFRVLSRKVDKTEFDESISREKYSDLGQLVLSDETLQVAVKTNKDKIEWLRYPAVLAKHEISNINTGLEGLDDLIYEIYCSEDRLREIYHSGILDKKFKKSLSELKFIETLDCIHDWYNDHSMGGYRVISNMVVSEWGILNEVYSDVLIGGDGSDSPFI